MTFLHSPLSHVSVYAFMASRFLMLVFIYGAALIQFVYLIEITAPKYRTSFGVNANLMFSIGIGVLSGIGNIGTDWISMSRILGILPLLILFAMPFMDESWRWYHSKGMFEHAKTSLIQFSARCGVKLDTKSAEEILNSDSESNESEKLSST